MRPDNADTPSNAILLAQALQPEMQWRVKQ